MTFQQTDDHDGQLGEPPQPTGDSARDIREMVVVGVALTRKLMRRPLDAELSDQLTALILAGELPRSPASTA